MKQHGRNTTRLALLLISILSVFTSCSSGNGKSILKTDTLPEYNSVEKYTDSKSGPDSSLRMGEIPVLCYHQVRDWKSSDSRNNRVFIVPIASFKEQMKMLHDNGYNSILPDQLIAYIKKGERLPPNPIMLTFDDATASQYTNALPELDSNGFKGVFFIMTVVLGHERYMSRDEVKALSEEGHIIGCHTWNHEDVTKYNEQDWAIQIEKPRAALESITGKPVKYFAYPYGLWNNNAIEHIKKYGFAAAFRLWGKPDTEGSLYTIRRILVDGNWNSAQLLKAIKKETSI